MNTEVEEPPRCYAHPVPQFGCAECFEASTLWRCRCGDYRLASSALCLVCRSRRPRIGSVQAGREARRAAGIAAQLMLPVSMTALTLPDRRWFELRRDVDEALAQRNPVLDGRMP